MVKGVNGVLILPGWTAWLLLFVTTWAFIGDFSEEPFWAGPIEAAGSVSIPASSGEEVEIRVLLSCQGRVKLFSRQEALLIEDRNGKEWGVLPVNGSYYVERSAQGWSISSSSGNKLFGAIGEGDLEIQPEHNGGFRVELDDKPCSYSGKLRLICQDDGRIAIVNIIGIETYLAGVVGAEAYSDWRLPALRAQAIASRTYALYNLSLNRSSSWDIGSNQGSQMYLGKSSSHKRVSQSVGDTRGVVMAYGKRGRERIFPTYYCSNCGGHTQEAASVFGMKVPPLSGQFCPYCGKVAHADKYRWPAVTIEKWQVNDLLHRRYPDDLKILGKIVNVQVTRTSEYGRVERMRLTGASGKSIIVRAEDFRLAMLAGGKDILSSWYELEDLGESWRFSEGRGWGHGVGMCQWGTQAMALSGKDCVEILEFYYPQMQLVRAY